MMMMMMMVMLMVMTMIMMMMVMVSMVVGGEWLGLLVLPITLECPNHSPRWP